MSAPLAGKVVALVGQGRYADAIDLFEEGLARFAELGDAEFLAALYRHFSGTAKTFEGLIHRIEQTGVGLVNKIQAEERDAMKQVEATIATLLGFAQKNPGMTRVLIGDALVNEDERLQARVNQLLDRLEASLRQSARLAVTAGALPADWDVNAYANAVIAFVMGRWHQFAKSGFKRTPMDGWPQQWRVFAA